MTGFKSVVGMVNGMLEEMKITVPVALHLDHGTYEGCLKCIDAGFSSIMFDGSHYPIEENVEKTKELIRICREKGMSLEENTAWLEENRLHICHWFTVDDLDFLKRGGRISPTIAWIGGKLKIKPVLRIAEDGTLAIPEKVRGSKAAMNTIVSKYVSSGLNEEHPYVFLCHGDAVEQAEKAKAAILEAVPGAQVTIMPMSPIIGIHTGPGVQAVIYFGNNR